MYFLFLFCILIQNEINCYPQYDYLEEVDYPLNELRRLENVDGIPKNLYTQVGNLAVLSYLGNYVNDDEAEPRDNGDVKNGQHKKHNYDHKHKLRSQSNERKFFDFITKYFHTTTTTVKPVVIKTTVEPNPKTIEEDVLETLKNLLETLKDISEVLKELTSVALPDYGNNFLHVKPKRPKRQINDSAEITNDPPTSKLNELNPTKNASKSNTNSTVLENTPVLTRRSNSNHELHLRANNVGYLTEVKSKLLHYIEETFNEMKTRFAALVNVKNKYAADNKYRLGYLVANLDMLDETMSKLKNGTDTQKHVLTEKQILDIFDKLKSTNKVVVSLLQNVRTFVENDLIASNQKGNVINNLNKAI